MLLTLLKSPASVSVMRRIIHAAQRLPPRSMLCACSIGTYTRTAARPRGARSTKHTPTGPARELSSCDSDSILTIPKTQSQELDPTEYYSACGQVYCLITIRKFLHALIRMYARCRRVLCMHFACARRASPLPERGSNSPGTLAYARLLACRAWTAPTRGSPVRSGLRYAAGTK